MGLMAGMLPGVEFARRRRLRPAAEAPCAGTRRPSWLGMFGHDHAHLGSAGLTKQRSGVCEEAWTTQRHSIAREAKERLDQKLRSQRESVVKRRHSTGSLRLPVPSSTTSDADATPAASALQREVFTKKGGGRRFSWGRRKEQQQAECAVCLEEFRAGDVRQGIPGGGRAGAPPLRAPLPLGLRRALGPGRLPLPLLPRRRQPRRRPPTCLAHVSFFPAGAAARAGPADQLTKARRWSCVVQYSRHLRMGCLVSWPRPAGKLQRVGQRRTAAAAAVYGARVAGVAWESSMWWCAERRVRPCHRGRGSCSSGGPHLAVDYFVSVVASFVSVGLPIYCHVALYCVLLSTVLGCLFKK